MRPQRRKGDAASVSAYTVRLQNGESRAAIAMEIWRSDEHRLLQIADSFGNLLNRFPSADDSNAYLNMFHRGKKEEDVLRDIITSPEALSKAAAGTTTASLLDSWLTGTGALGRNVNAYYQEFLHRTADADGQAGYTAQMAAHGLESVAISLMTSDEFWNLYGAKY